ncbi:hypothetical protein FD14_GL000813 [Secundilactobacillus similis DSM 23365 = JCM 2765]|uniref:Uncharacterized protein n=1 Tax=Secundilactobacillus similis DSM 23365 = JCM 2765 TaxID=1423804 RepID=A0A0R2FB93_9LACO|nr:hypothetical protein FD14_GL000813 [Secundilactobacillus similis DSM 23365 = JCM 2765]
MNFDLVSALIMGDIVGTAGRSENLGWNAVGTILSRKTRLRIRPFTKLESSPAK